MKELPQVRVLTFDCYGTLIDWESGIFSALQPVLQAHRVGMEADTILEHYARYESRLELPPFRTYREVLRAVVRSFATECGFDATPDEERVLEKSLPTWRPFEDTVASLRKLQERYALGVISNTDDDLFELTSRELGVKFTHLITSMQVQSYKPSQTNFLRAIEQWKIEPSQILHVAQSLHHDIPSAKSCGMHTVWIDRRKGKTGSGATLPSNAEPDLIFPDLKSLVSFIG
ncbi:MAG TPA: haloacid dehalogenase type II [Bacteroidota bacterium]|nr:haloacid dehalogenase type II [Bacteroidota bacterium]